MCRNRITNSKSVLKIWYRTFNLLYPKKIFKKTLVLTNSISRLVLDLLIFVAGYHENIDNAIRVNEQNIKVKAPNWNKTYSSMSLQLTNLFQFTARKSSIT